MASSSWEEGVGTLLNPTQVESETPTRHIDLLLS